MILQIRALKLAIKEMSNSIPYLNDNLDDTFYAISLCKEALAQAELIQQQFKDNATLASHPMRNPND